MHITAITNLDGDHACTRYRLANPLTLLQAKGHHIQFLGCQIDRAWTPQWFYGQDVVILQRWVDPKIHDLLLYIPPSHRPAVIYETDDLLWGIADRKYCREIAEHERSILSTIAGCDAAIVSTSGLFREVSALKGPPCHVWQNSIDYGLRDWQQRVESRPEGIRLVIGWAGLMRPSDDIEQVGRALSAVLRQHKDVACAMIGEDRMVREWGHRLQIPRRQFWALPRATFDSYPCALTCFDIGLAPQALNRFNACKSWLKIMEYGAQGIPYIASPIASYGEFHAATGAVGGFLCEKEEHWKEALRGLILNDELRMAMGEQIKERVRQQFDLAQRVSAYEEILAGVCDDARRARSRFAADRGGSGRDDLVEQARPEPA